MSNEPETELPAGVLAMLLAEPPANLLGLALRWVPVDTGRACRIAALACAMTRGGVDLTVKRLGDDPVVQVAEFYRAWLAGTGDVPAEEMALRIYTLHFALQMTPPGTSPDGVVKAADLLYGWFAVSKTRRWS
jgi:hypothetical protein